MSVVQLSCMESIRIARSTSNDSDGPDSRKRIPLNHRNRSWWQRFHAKLGFPEDSLRRRVLSKRNPRPPKIKFTDLYTLRGDNVASTLLNLGNVPEGRRV